MGQAKPATWYDEHGVPQHLVAGTLMAEYRSLRGCDENAAVDWEQDIAAGGGPCLPLGAERRLRRS